MSPSQIQFQTSDGFFQPFAFAECLQQALLTATNEDLAVYAIPPAPPGGSVASPYDALGAVRVLRALHEHRALPSRRVTGMSSTHSPSLTADKPSLIQRSTGWNPPPTRPEVPAIRRPPPLKCPPGM